MKRLFYFRHSSKDGANNTLGPKGLELAHKVGDWLYDTENGGEDDGLGFDKVFHGPLVRTAQTALSFMLGYGYGGDVMPIVPEIGDDALFAEMVKPSQFRTLASAMGNFKALLQCHDPNQSAEWIYLAFSAVENIFSAMNDSETGVAFGHSPMIELALAKVLGTTELPEEYLTFGDMEGVEFQQEEGEAIKVVRKIAMPAQPAA